MSSIQQTYSNASRDTSRNLTAAVLMALFASTICYLRFFVLPDVPTLPGSDQIMAASDGARIVAGQLPYRDFFEFIPPGSPLTYAALVKIFGVRIWITGLVMAFLAAAVALLITLAASRVMRGAIVLLPALMFTGFILLPSADTTHNWFSTVLVLAAMLVLFGELTLPRIAVAGIICGLAASFTQTKGATALLGFVAYLIWRARRDRPPTKQMWLSCFVLCASGLAAFAAISAYFIGAAGLSRWFYWLVVYPTRYFAVPENNNWRIIPYEFRRSFRGVSTGIAWSFLCCTVPVVYLVFLFERYRRRKSLERAKSDELLILVTLTGLAMFLSIASSPSLVRMGTVSPPAMILLAALLDRHERPFVLLKRGLGAFAFVLAIAAAVATQRKHFLYADRPSGRVAFNDPLLQEEYVWIKDHTRPGQPFWGLATLYFPFQLRHTAALEQLCSCDYTRPEDVAGLVRSLQETRVPTVIISSQRKYPLTENSPGNHLGPFVAYLYANYQLTKIFRTGDEVWEIRSHARDSTPVESAGGFKR